MDEITNATRAAFLSSLDKALASSEETRKFLNESHRKKMGKYPLKVLLSKLVIKIFPSAASLFVIKNKLFFGAPFYTEGYYMDYYLCGLTNSDSENRLAKWLIKNLEKNGVFLDVGANFGFFTVLARAMFGDDPADGSPHIYAFEPTPSIFKILSKNGSCKNIALNNFALGAIDGEADFIMRDSIKEFNGLSANLDEKELPIGGYKKEKIEVRTIDSYCKQLNVVPTLIKIDVEGGELDVIKGALSMIRAGKPKIAMEVQSKERNQKHCAAARILLDAGYSIFRIGKDGEEISDTIAYLENLEDFDNVVFAIREK